MTPKRKLKSKILAPTLGAAVGLASLLGAAVPGAAGASPLTSTPGGTELAPLVQKMEELNVSSLHVSGEITLSGHLPRKLLALKEQLLTFNGEENTFPPAASITETALGKTATIRLVGEKVYVEEPALAAHDGGRAWVEADAKEAGTAPSLNSGTALGGSLGKFKGTATLLGDATNVTSLGASTVEGQSVTGFTGTIAPVAIEDRNLPAGLRTRIRKLNLRLSGAFEVFLASDGLPVRSVLTLGIGDVHMKVSENVISVDQPIAPVTAPLASETITLGAVHALAKKKAGAKRAAKTA